MSLNDSVTGGQLEDSEQFNIKSARSAFRWQSTVSKISSQEESEQFSVTKDEAEQFFFRSSPDTEADISTGSTINELVDSDPITKPCERRKAFKKPSLGKEEERLIIYSPSSQPLTNDEKYGGDPAEDGLYVDKSARQSRNSPSCNKLEQRLYTERGTSWFETLSSWFWKSNEVYWNLVETASDFEKTRIKPVYEPSKTREQLAASLRKSSSTCKLNLIVSVKSVKFTSHELFGDEDIAAAELTRCFDRFETFNKTKNVSLLCSKIKAFELSISNLGKQFDETDEEDLTSLTSERTARLEAYRKEVLKLYQERLDTVKEQRAALFSLLSAWEALQAIRAGQNFQNSPLVLSFKEESQTEADEKAEEKVLNELKQEYKEAAKNRKLSESAPKENQDGANEENDDEVESVNQRISDETFLLDGRLPGEPVFYDVCLAEQLKSVTMEADLPQVEKNRQSAIRKLKFFIAINQDGRQQTKTPKAMAEENFEVQWSSLLSLELTSMRSNLQLELWQSRGSKDTTVATMQLVLPDRSIIESEEPEMVSKSLLSSTESADLKAVLSYSIYWKSDSSSGVDGFMATNGQSDQSAKLRTLIFDPHDPDNIYNKEQTKFGSTSVEDANDGSFCSMQEALQNPRIKLLMLRAQGEPELQNVAIPADEKDIPLELLEKFFPKRRTRRDADSQEGQGLRKFSLAGKQVIQIQKKQLKWEDLVHEHHEPESSSKLDQITTDFFTATQRRRRPLRPIRKQRSKSSEDIDEERS
ncbi:Coiled-coil and C2 domain-containing protein 2A [Halotydeus destructor]|nr:Coiled-coil and C2 domain-containing protein 2A [Halotydeus destructor]